MQLREEGKGLTEPLHVVAAVCSCKLDELVVGSERQVTLREKISQLLCFWGWQLQTKTPRAQCPTNVTLEATSRLVRANLDVDDPAALSRWPPFFCPTLPDRTS